MKLLVDQDVYAVTVRYLQRLGADVMTCRQAGVAGARDSEILASAFRAGRAVVTRDRDFGNLVFAFGLPNPGVLYLRMEPDALNAVHDELGRFVTEHLGEDLRGWFVVVEPGRHRIRR